MLESLLILENKLDKLDKKLTRIVCPFFKYEKSSKFELFIDEDLGLQIKLNCHNHILSIKTYFNYFFKNIIVTKKNSCDYHGQQFKSIAYCFKCSIDICQNRLSDKHSSHGILNYSNAEENSELIKKEYNELLNQISFLKENITKIDNSNPIKKNCFETLFFLFLIKRMHMMNIYMI